MKFRVIFHLTMGTQVHFHTEAESREEAQRQVMGYGEQPASGGPKPYHDSRGNPVAWQQGARVLLASHVLFFDVEPE